MVGARIFQWLTLTSTPLPSWPSLLVTSARASQASRCCSKPGHSYTLRQLSSCDQFGPEWSSLEFHGYTFEWLGFSTDMSFGKKCPLPFDQACSIQLVPWFLRILRRFRQCCEVEGISSSLSPLGSFERYKSSNLTWQRSPAVGQTIFPLRGKTALTIVVSLGTRPSNLCSNNFSRQQIPLIFSLLELY